ncbi:kynureninase [Pedobacter cryophilus]|uniref:Kynureninase n=1 Tax=Pedobacter cryophilus TaxID=2571271 RepID=A0A4V5NZ80_9SPHI|nr:kynureninase [Pedobacter cryophilus]TKB95890.1 kynureninase [Pedobacter cryophilus]
MQFTNTLAFAQQQDQEDELQHFRNEFLIPKHEGKEITYLCGNSLGLQPKNTRQFINEQLDYWEKYGVEGWFDGEQPWLAYHHEISDLLAPILGAKPIEVTCMNNLTINLHLLMVSFYQPKGKKYKILMEGGAFPSDQYAIESQVKFRGYNADDAIIEVFPRAGEETLRTEDILEKINKHKKELALILFGGINYYTGQVFDMKTITKAGHDIGALVGFDLAHAAGNVPVQLHNWEVDFACWCSYKYMNSSPGGISGIFVHEKHFEADLPRFAGWWGYQLDKRFKMDKGFVPEKGAEGWQVSTSPILMMAAHKASLKVFEKAGFANMRAKSIRLTGFLEFLIQQVNEALGEEFFKIITPKNPEERGCQLSLICKQDGKLIFDALVKQQIIGDWREPNVIRVSPVPLYNTFKDVFAFADALLEISLKLKPTN